MTVDKDYIEKITKDFISKSISDQNPAGLCFPTSLLLQVYLGTKKIKSSLIKGEVPQVKSDGTSHNIEHYWIQIDSTDVIVDATIQQFKNPEPIYVGKLQDNEITKTYIPNKLELNLWFPIAFTSWKYNYETTCPITPLDGLYEKRSITYTIKLATILHSECKKLTSVDEFINYYYGLYLGPIYFFLYHRHIGIINFEIKRENMPEEFDSLLSEVVQWGDKIQKEMRD